jgi:hypothetical protein
MSSDEPLAFLLPSRSTVRSYKVTPAGGVHDATASENLNRCWSNGIGTD